MCFFVKHLHKIKKLQYVNPKNPKQGRKLN